MTDASRQNGRCHCRDDGPAYVLGALDAAEARAFARHLEHCAACRDEVAALTPVVDSLAGSAPVLGVPKSLRRRVLRSVRAEARKAPPRPRRAPAAPRRRRLPRLNLRRPAVAGAVALACAVALVAYTSFGSSSPGTRTIRAAVGRAELRLAAGGRAELVVDHLAPAPAGRTYQLWLVRGGRAPAPSTLFGVNARGTADLGVPGGVAGVRRVLVTLEPARGSRAPTTPPVISVPIA